jgi:hypothetical protein
MCGVLVWRHLREQGPKPGCHAELAPHSYKRHNSIEMEIENVPVGGAFAAAGTTLESGQRETTPDHGQVEGGADACPSLDAEDSDDDEAADENTAVGENDVNSNWIWEEYKIIQSKIDKIGEFQFKVKSWSITLMGAVLFGGVALSRFLPALVGGLWVVGIFHLSERRQRLNGQRLGRRASAIENGLRAFPPRGFTASQWERMKRLSPELKVTPGIADAIVGRKNERWDSQWLWEDRPAILRWMVRHADDLFYVAQYVLLLFLFIWFALAQTSNFWWPWLKEQFE